MTRRHFLAGASVLPAGLALPLSANSFAGERLSPDWRTFEVKTRIEIFKPSGATRIWAPEAMLGDTRFQRTISNTFQCSGGIVKTLRNRRQGLGIVAAEFPSGARPLLTVISRVATRNWSESLSARGKRENTAPSQLSDFLQPAKMIPTGGIVKQKATEITRNARTDVDKARAIYEWIVENTYRNPSTRGCGTGNIRSMLESGNLGGKCADLNALFVGLARAAGLPARDLYGVRVAGSKAGYKSLGASSTNVTQAQHCRAEVYLHEYGWFPVDPADVRKVMLEEPPGHRSLDDEIVKKARAGLFGSWEMNWIAYNFAHDVALPGSNGPAVPFLMYPQAETADGRLDSLDPSRFRYDITVKEPAQNGARR